MPFTASNNEIVYKRGENLAAALQNIFEEATRITNLAAEFSADIADLPSGDHLRDELIALNTNVLQPFMGFMDGTSQPAQRDRIADLQEWLTS